MLPSILVAAPLVLLGLAAHPRAEHPAPDPRAVELAASVMEALGGQAAWDNTRYLRFDFAVEREGRKLVRSHTWDKWQGRYRLESVTPEGKPAVVLMNLHDREGDAWVDGQQLAGEEEKKALERAFGAWTNDTYWLLMPYKLRDPGVLLAAAGEETSEVGTWDKLHLRFENVGLTPKDQYWVYVNRSTRLVDRWDFVLKGEDVPPTTFLWKGWKRVGNVMLASERENAKDGRMITFPVLEAPASLPDSVFESPTPVPPAPEP
jgi:hypothetical protein